MRYSVSKRSLALIVAGVAILGAMIGGVVAARGSDTPELPRGDALLADVNSGIASDPGKADAIGQLTRVKQGIFAGSQGDLVDVDLLAGKGGIRCLSISGDAYSSSVGCFDQKDAAKSGSYQVVIPVRSDAPTLVVGFAPSGKSRVTANAGGLEARAVVRGQVFVATLEAGALGANNNTPVGVRYGS